MCIIFQSRAQNKKIWENISHTHKTKKNRQILTVSHGFFFFFVVVDVLLLDDGCDEFTGRLTVDKYAWLFLVYSLDFRD